MEDSSQYTRACIVASQVSDHAYAVRPGAKVFHCPISFHSCERSWIDRVRRNSVGMEWSRERYSKRSSVEAY